MASSWKGRLVYDRPDASSERGSLRVGAVGTPERRVVWPLAAAVHLAPLADTATCWRCHP